MLAVLQFLDAPEGVLMLDPLIRNWVLFPILIVMLVSGIVRQYGTQLLHDKKKPTAADLTNQALMTRSKMLRTNGNFIPRQSFLMRQTFLRRKLTLGSEAEAGDQMPSGADPMQAVGMMKQSISGILPQLLLGGWVNYFFPGFILVKLPFALPSRFKVMLQRGMPLDNLDVAYVTSLSWYFINLIGLRGVNTLILGQAAMVSDPMLQQMRMQESAGMSKQDPAKLCKQEKNELEISTHDPMVVHAALYQVQGYQAPASS